VNAKREKRVAAIDWRDWEWQLSLGEPFLFYGAGERHFTGERIDNYQVII